jgi:hypothetical protein
LAPDRRQFPAYLGNYWEYLEVEALRLAMSAFPAHVLNDLEVGFPKSGEQGKIAGEVGMLRSGTC